MRAPNLLAGLLALAASAVVAAGQPFPLTRDVESTAKIVQYKGAVLFKDGHQTSCEIALLGWKSGFVAANCLNFTRKATLDTSVVYAVYLDDSSTGSVVIPSTLFPEDIHIHPDYDPETLANNVAVVEFNKGVDNEYLSFIGLELSGNGVRIHVRRTLANGANKWNQPDTQIGEEDDPDCRNYSLLYANNPGWLSCNRFTLPTTNYPCQVPYSTVYMVERGYLMLTGLYSHSVLFNGDSCSKQARWLSYYTRLGPYVGFASSILKRPLNLYTAERGNYNATNTTMATMNNVGPVDPNGSNMAGGDFYELQRVMEEAPASESIHEIKPNESVIETKPNENVDSAGLSQAQKIVIGIVVPVGVILITIGSVVLFNMWKSKRQDNAWDPHSQTVALQRAAWDLGDGDNVAVPPPYEEANQETTQPQLVAKDPLKD